MKTLIVYATHTGSTLYAARELAGVLSETGEIELKTARETSVEDINSADLLLIGSSSWDWEGNRGYPLAEMMNFLERIEEIEFSGKKMALFGCGDTDFENFCGALDVIGEKLSQKGANYLIDHLRLDRYFIDEIGNQEKVREWALDLENRINN